MTNKNNEQNKHTTVRRRTTKVAWWEHILRVILLPVFFVVRIYRWTYHYDW